MAWFSAFRNEYGFSSYKDNRTAVSYDISLLIVIYICGLVAVATLVTTLGIRGRERWSSMIRAMYAVVIGSIILVCLVGSGWQEGTIKIKSNYLYRSHLPFEGQVGIRVALDFVNVTLDGYYESQAGPGYVYYAETLPWSDFGREEEHYSFYLRKGLPDPILKVMEFLTIDQGDLRWGRSLHTSGYYAMTLLWTSFAFWVISNVLLCSVVVYGAYMFTLTGLTMVLACVTYHVCQCPISLVIDFSERSLRLTYSWSYWLTLTSGCLTFIFGIVLIICDHVVHEGVSEFFHLEKLTDDDPAESDYRKESQYTPNTVKDRRGSEFPPTRERRGSIFMDSCRSQGLLSEPYFNFSPNHSLFKGTQFSDKTTSPMKVNPVFDGETDKITDQEKDLRSEMERVCLDCDVCLSTRKPSLATLKEHRENHANERRSSNSGDIHTGKYVRNSPYIRKDNYQEGIFSNGCIPKENTIPLNGLRRGSCPNNLYLLPILERTLSEASHESDSSQRHLPQSPQSQPTNTSCKVLSAAESLEDVSCPHSIVVERCSTENEGEGREIEVCSLTTQEKTDETRLKESEKKESGSQRETASAVSHDEETHEMECQIPIIESTDCVVDISL